MTTSYKFKAGYTKAGVATAPSPAPTINVVNVATDALVVTGGTPTASSTMAGVYSYTYSGSASLDLVGLFHTTDATVDQQDLFCIDVDALVLASVSLGSGAVSWTVTVNDGTNPLDGVEVWVTTDAGGTNTVASGQTDTLGQVTFNLDAGTYYCWKQLSGYNFSNPETMAVA